MEQRHLRWTRIFAYAAPVIVTAFMEQLISFYYLKYATDTLLIAPATIGVLFVVARLVDAITDPLFGFLSDRTVSRMGRRRSWIMVAFLPLAMGFVGVWRPDLFLGIQPSVFTVGLSLLIFYAAQSAFTIPHMAWGAELAATSHDRTRLFGVRMAIALFGVFTAALLLGQLERAQDPQAQAGMIVTTAFVVLGVMLTIALSNTQGTTVHRASERATFQSLLQIARNRNAALIAGIVFLQTMGFTTMTAAMAFANEYVHGFENQTSIMLMGALLVMLLTIPLWMGLSRRFGKKRVWQISLVGRGIAFGCLALTPAGNWPLILILVIVIGAFYGCGDLLAPSVKSDVIEADAQRTGVQKGGTYFALWNFAQKCGAGLAVGVSGLLLGVFGFEIGAAQSETAKLGIRFIYAGLPCIFYLIAALMLGRYKTQAGAEHPVMDPPATRA